MLPVCCLLFWKNAGWRHSWKILLLSNSAQCFEKAALDFIPWTCTRVMLTLASSTTGRSNRSLCTIYFHSAGLIHYIVSYCLCLSLLKSFEITRAVSKSSIPNGTTKHRIIFICKQHALDCCDLFRSHHSYPISWDLSTLKGQNKQLPIILSLGQQINTIIYAVHVFRKVDCIWKHSLFKIMSWLSYKPEGFCIIQVQYKIICEIIMNLCHLFMVKVPMDL